MSESETRVLEYVAYIFFLTHHLNPLKSSLIPTMTWKMFMLFARWILKSKDMFNFSFIQRPVAFDSLLTPSFPLTSITSFYSHFNKHLFTIPSQGSISLLRIQTVVPWGPIHSNLPIIYFFSFPRKPLSWIQSSSVS